MRNPICDQLLPETLLHRVAGALSCQGTSEPQTRVVRRERNHSEIRDHPSTEARPMVVAGALSATSRMKPLFSVLGERNPSEIRDQRKIVTPLGNVAGASCQHSLVTRRGIAGSASIHEFRDHAICETQQGSVAGALSANEVLNPLLGMRRERNPFEIGGHRRCATRCLNAASVDRPFAL